MTGLTSRVEELMGPRLKERSVWMAMKAVYSAHIAQSVRWEIAESFFNSLTRRVFTTEGVDQSIEFVDTDFDAPPTGANSQGRRRYHGEDLRTLLFAVLNETAAGFAEHEWHDLPSSIESAVARLTEAIPCSTGAEIEVVTAIFYRGRGGYLVGRQLCDQKATPIAFALRHPSGQGITLDAVLIGESDLAVLFSYTRAYFRVDAPYPFDLVRWLRELMPRKRLADLYNALGYNRHAKTEFYRDFVRHLQNSDDCFTAATGTRGMVMVVFTCRATTLFSN